MFQLGDLVRTSTDRLAIVVSDAGGLNVVCLNVREHDKRAYHRECLTKVDEIVKVCGSVWFLLDGPKQWPYIERYGDNLHVLACSCTPAGNCQGDLPQV